MRFVNLTDKHLSFEVLRQEYSVPPMGECEMPAKHALSVELHGIPLTKAEDVTPAPKQVELVSTVAPAAPAEEKKSKK